MAYQRGVFVSEQGTSLTVPLQSTAGLQVVFGTAPTLKEKRLAKAGGGRGWQHAI